MTSSSASVWRHPVLEGLAVLVGILIAFGLEAAWQERSARLEERDNLVALRSELEDARRHFVSRDEALAADMAQTDRVREELNSFAIQTVPDDSINALAVALGPMAVRVPPRAALDDLLSSGGIRRVRSAELRRAVAGYVQALEADVRVQGTAAELWLGHLTPYRYAHSTLVPGLSAQTRPDIPISVDRDAYVGSRTYTNLLGARILRARDVRSSHRAVLVKLEEVVGVLDALGVNSAS